MTDKQLLADLDEFLLGKVPASVVVESARKDGYRFVKAGPGDYNLSVIAAIAIQSDGKRWVHFSLGRWNKRMTKMRQPKYDDIRWLKDVFVGDDRKAIMVFPKAKFYVNLHEVLHIFCCLDEDPLPEFSGFRKEFDDGNTRTI